MKKSYTKGTKGLIIATIVMVLLSLGSIAATINGFKDVKTLYEDGERFEGESGYSIIKVLAIEELAIEDEVLEEDEKFYMIESANSFVILKSTREDLKKIMGDNLKEDEKIKFVTDDVYARISGVPEKSTGRRSSRINISKELKEKFRKSAQKSLLINININTISKKYEDKELFQQKIKERPLYLDVYITPSGKEYYVFNIVFSSIMSLITMIMGLNIIKRIRRARLNYENMFITYPEVERDLDILLRDAQYKDETLKVIIYKDSLIVYKKVFSFELLDELEEVVFKKNTNKGNIVGYSILIGKKDNTWNSEIKIAKKKDEENIQKLVKYLKKHYSVKANIY